ncbi:MAG: hypothetical protein IJT34_09440, partial [Butyrivibrio sp.]|nr:hypothetical protein [Butyrivibrio sp.]
LEQVVGGEDTDTIHGIKKPRLRPDGEPEQPVHIPSDIPPMMPVKMPDQPYIMTPEDIKKLVKRP